MFVEDAVIHVLQRRINYLREPIAVLAYHIEACLQSRFARRRQQPPGPGSELGVRQVQRIQQQKVTKMEDPGAHFAEFKILCIPQRIRAPRMKERSPAVPLFGHHISVRSGSFPGSFDEASIDAVCPAILQNLPSQIILTDQPGSEEREGSP